MRRNQMISVLSVVVALVLAAGLSHAATITIVNNDGAGEGFNDPTPVSPVGGNTGTTLGAQRLIVFQTAADQWAALIESDIEILVSAQFNPLTCDANGAVLGSCGSTYVIRDFPNAPVAGTWYSAALANALAGSDLDGRTDMTAQFSSTIDDDPSCLGGVGWYYGLDGTPDVQEHLYPVILHELGHGLGFQNFANESTGALFGGLPDIYTMFTYDETTGKHWDEMNNAERIASAINTNNVVWDGPEGLDAARAWLAAQDMDFVVTTPPPVAGTYSVVGALFGASGWESDGFSGLMELADDGTGLPTEACNPLVGFTPGRVAFIDRGTCEFGVKAYNAQEAGASGVVIANNQAGTVNMAGGEFGHLVTVPVVAMTQTDGNIIRTQLPGVDMTLNLQQLWGAHVTSGYPLLYAPSPVEMGSSISHWDITAFPDALMEPFTNEDEFNNVDMTPGLFRDIGWITVGSDVLFNDGFESGDTSAWSSVSP